MNLNNELLQWAHLYVGLAEVEGDASNPIIMEMAATLGAPHYTSDAREWCGLFLAYTAHNARCEIPAGFLIARNWLSVGAPVLRPYQGVVCVLWSGTPEGTDGHAGFWVGEDDKNVWLLGGNQVNSVRQFFYPKERILGYRQLRRAV